MKTVMIKPSGIISIHGHKKLTKLDRQLWNILYSKAYDLLIDGKDEFEVLEKDILEFIPYETRNIEHIKKSLQRLQTVLVSGNYLNKDNKNVWASFQLMGSVELLKGVCRFSYPKKLQELIKNPRVYSKISLLMLMNFRSKYGIILYEIGIDYHKAKGLCTPWMTLSQFKELMGLKPNSYQDYKNLKRKVINVGMDDVNSKSNVILNLETKKDLKDKKTITHVRFHIQIDDDFNMEEFKPEELMMLSDQKKKYLESKAIKMERSLAGIKEMLAAEPV